MSPQTATVLADDTVTLSETDRSRLHTFVTFFKETETWIDPSVERVYAILDNPHVPWVVSTRL